ncbi:aryl-alcohol dehydrogenase-like predicted oxidoreductase [Desulfitispora alkaliphila]|uniref:aldo/keto reductase n=1 Tax=Desulfitispora alkaliphila TaxID=622674 RepID=UPI003D1A3E69
MVERLELTKDYTISRVINGCWQLSQGHSLKEKLDMQDVMTAFHELVERGFTTFDCADIYTGAEEFLGSFLQELKNNSTLSPKDVQIHTKYVPDINLLKEVNFNYTEKIIDRSLKRLNQEALDLVQFHWWDYDVPKYVETAYHLKELKKKGKIRHIGVTNFDTKHLKKLVDAGIPIVSSQSQYSVFDRRIEKSLQSYCQSEGIHQLCYGTLSGGLTSEKYLRKTSLELETRSQVKYLQVIEETLGLEGFQKLLTLLNKIAKKHGVQIPHIATKYILSQPGIAASIIGVRNSRHVQSNSRIFAFHLEQEDVQEIGQFLQSYPILEGEPFELERTVGSKFQNIMKMNLNEE